MPPGPTRGRVSRPRASASVPVSPPEPGSVWVRASAPAPSAAPPPASPSRDCASCACPLLPFLPCPLSCLVPDHGSRRRFRCLTATAFIEAPHDGRGERIVGREVGDLFG